MPGYKTKLKKIFKIGNSQEKQIGLLDISRMRAKNKKIKKNISKSIHVVQKFLIL